MITLVGEKDRRIEGKKEEEENVRAARAFT